MVGHNVGIYNDINIQKKVVETVVRSLGADVWMQSTRLGVLFSFLTYNWHEKMPCLLRVSTQFGTGSITTQSLVKYPRLLVENDGRDAAGREE